jgi:hypothetical protein
LSPLCLNPGRPIAQPNHCDGPVGERQVGPGRRKRAARPSAGSSLRRVHLKPHERCRAKGVERDTVTRVTHTGRTSGRSGRDHGTETLPSFAAEKRGPIRPRNPRQWVAERQPESSGWRMTHGGLGAQWMKMKQCASRRQSEPVSPTRGNDPRTIARFASPSANENRRNEQASRRCVGAHGVARPAGDPSVARRWKGEGGRATPANVEAGQPARWHLPAYARRGWQALKGIKTSREASARPSRGSHAARSRAHRERRGAIERTGGARSARSARDVCPWPRCCASPCPRGSGGRGPVRRSARRLPRTTPSD